MIGTEDYFVAPENRSDVYMAFQYFHYNSKAGTLLARSNDNGRSYSFLSWIGPLAAEKAADGGASFEQKMIFLSAVLLLVLLFFIVLP